MAFSIYTIYGVISPIFRKRRIKWFMSVLEPTDATKILDVGGYPATWTTLPVRPTITILNIHEINYQAEPGHPPMQTVIGDGCNLAYPDRSFDLVFSNSVIEHLGTFERQQAFARECRRAGDQLWIQTPAKSFFIEPHMIAPFVHYFPVGIQKKLLRYFTLYGWFNKPTPAQVQGFFDEIRLLDFKEMHALFPDCEILREKSLGFTKSYIAVRRGASKGL